MPPRMSGLQWDGSVRPVYAPLISPQIGIGRPRKAPLCTSNNPPGAHRIREHSKRNARRLFTSHTVVEHMKTAPRRSN